MATSPHRPVRAVVVADLLFVDDPAPGAATVTGPNGTLVGAPITALRHPGGQPRALQAFGDLVLAGTTAKRVVAYDSRGWRRWTVEVDDAPEHLVRIDDTTFALQTTTGTLQARRLDTGALLWEHRLGVGARSCSTPPPDEPSAASVTTPAPSGPWGPRSCSPSTPRAGPCGRVTESSCRARWPDRPRTVAPCCAVRARRPP